MKDLQSRMAEVSAADNLPIVVIDSILPRQVLRLEVGAGEDQALCDLLQARQEDGTPFLGMVGVAPLMGQTHTAHAAAEWM